MKGIPVTESLGLELAQLAWVVPDIRATEDFFKKVMGVKDFYRIDNFHIKEHESTYYGRPNGFIDHVSMVWTAGIFIELIQPISGQTIFQDYLDKNPAGGLQHIAYRVPIAEFDKVIHAISGEGYPIISTFDTNIAKIYFFDTYKELGIATEIMGITDEGYAAVEQMKK